MKTWGSWPAGPQGALVVGLNDPAGQPRTEASSPALTSTGGPHVIRSVRATTKTSGDRPDATGTETLHEPGMQRPRNPRVGTVPHPHRTPGTHPTGTEPLPGLLRHTPMATPTHLRPHHTAVVLLPRLSLLPRAAVPPPPYRRGSHQAATSQRRDTGSRGLRQRTEPQTALSSMSLAPDSRSPANELRMMSSHSQGHPKKLNDDALSERALSISGSLGVWAFPGAEKR